MNTKTVLIVLLIISVIGIIFYFALNKKTETPQSGTVVIKNDTTSVSFPSFDFKQNSPENLALRTYRAATGQNAI